MLQLETISLGEVVLYPQLRYLCTPHGEVKLSRRDVDLLEALALCKGTMVTNAMLIAVAYGRHGRRANPVTLRAAVFRLRSRLAHVAAHIVIYQIRGHGYKLVLLDTPRTHRVRGFLYPW